MSATAAITISFTICFIVMIGYAACVWVRLHLTRRLARPFGERAHAPDSAPLDDPGDPSRPPGPSIEVKPSGRINAS